MPTVTETLALADALIIEVFASILVTESLILAEGLSTWAIYLPGQVPVAPTYIRLTRAAYDALLAELDSQQSQIQTEAEKKDVTYVI